MVCQGLTSKLDGHTNLILLQVLDPPSVTAGQLHDLALQPSLSRIARDRLATCPDGRFIIGTDPRGQALIWHLAGDISIERSQELIM